MPQSPLQVDAVQIEPGSGDTLTIARDGDGNLVFTDATLSSGATLTELAGLRSVGQVITVGLSGSGAAYNTIQEALDAVPGTASETEPYTILVAPGVYAENLTLEKDGVFLVGLGMPVIRAATGDTITVQSAVASTPKCFEIKNFRVESEEAGKACLLFVGGAGSEVFSTRGRITNCDLKASGAGGFALKADSVNHILAQGGDWGDGNLLSSVRVTDCASLNLHGQSRLPALQLDNDAAGDTPSVVTSAYVVGGAGSVGDVQSTLTTSGSLRISQCGSVGDVTLNGDRSVEIFGCAVGDVAVNAGVAATIHSSRYGSLAGTGSLAATMQGAATFSDAVWVEVLFDVPMPDQSYVVSLEVGVDDMAWVTDKSAEGFTVRFSDIQTTSVGWVARRA